MRPKKVTVAAAAVGNWIPVSRGSPGDIGFTVHPLTSSAGTYDVNFTQSEMQKGVLNVPISRTTTTLTITLTAHGLTTADDVILYGVLGQDYNGRFKVASVTDANNITVTVANSGTATKANVLPIIVDTVTDFSAVSGLKSGNIFASTTALRLNCTSVTTAGVSLYINQDEH